MKTSQNQIAGNINEISLNGIKITMTFVGIFMLFMCTNRCAVYDQKRGEGANIAPPAWAPYYDNVNRVRYYYFPDIECYYDVWNREFVYLEDGSWMFGATLPPSYSWFDLNSAFIVLLDYDVFEPWMHFHYYVSHYPRYYYRTFYRDNNRDINRPMRGFNENGRASIYNNPRSVSNAENRTTIINNDTRNNEINRNENRRELNLNRQYPERRVEPTRPPQRMEYHGKDIGRPVNVQRNMMRPQRTGNRRR
jgi:hypothetical protein